MEGRAAAEEVVDDTYPRRSPDDFARAFAVGGAVAAVGIVGRLMVTSTPKAVA